MTAKTGEAQIKPPGDFMTPCAHAHTEPPVEIGYARPSPSILPSAYFDGTRTLASVRDGAQVVSDKSSLVGSDNE